ncbi:MAG TPA: family 78 glycoside hydrolase catalytic domain [Clostridiales bacterium]|nr:family 78 glycoside hydrolase catalytic domain [Clostridiales bacterium]
MNIRNMKLDHQIQPIAIENRNPCFSWTIETDEGNWRQGAYRILVSKQEGQDFKNESIWDTGWVISSAMVNIPYMGPELEPDEGYCWRVSVKPEHSEKVITSATAGFETALMKPENWHGKWIGEVADQDYHMFRKSFSLAKQVKKAKLYVCGLGHYEFYMNGSRVGQRELEPGWTNYEKTSLYSAYDVTELLQSGQNAMGALLGDGMYNVPGGRYVYFERSYGKCKMLVQLNITFTDGTHGEIVSDATWRMAPSPILFSCIYGGEEFDGRLEQPGFCRADFVEDDTWEPVNLVEPAKGRLLAQNIPPLKVMQTYEPVKIEETRPGVYLYDFGQNFSGRVRITLKAQGSQVGKTVTMTPGELLDAGKAPDQRVTGRGYRWEYTLNAGEIQTYAPKFTYTGFRYLQVEGAVPKEYAGDGENPPIICSITGEFIYPEVELNGEFTCSNALFNQIHGIIRQAILSNMKSYLTDCPHREKLAWLEQTHLIGPAIMYNYDVHNLYKKLEMDMKDAQHESGLVPDISPEYVVFGYHKGFIDSPEWGSAIIINPWYVYLRYGDTMLLEQYYGEMKKYLAYLTEKTHHHILHHGLGDWLDIGPNTPHSQNTPVPVVATAIYYYDLTIMKKVARLLGNKEDEAYYDGLMKSVYEEYNLQFFDDQTWRYATGSQAAQAMSLVFGLVDKKNEQKVLEYLVKDIKARGYATTAGDIGHPYVMEALTGFGKSDIINTMANVTDKPGYGYQVKCGATTLTEEWDGPQPDRPHGSQNHFMLGSIEEWFYCGLAGINGVRSYRALDEIQIKPHFAKGCDYVNAWTMHPYGKVAVLWERKDEDVLVKIQIPPNATGVFVNEFGGDELCFGSGEHRIRVTGTEAVLL